MPTQTKYICCQCGQECTVREKTERIPHPELDSGKTVEVLTYNLSGCCESDVEEQ